MKDRPRVFAVTGGPGGGKSSAIKELPLILSSHDLLKPDGIYALCLSEVATEFFAAGFKPATPAMTALEFQMELFMSQMEKEDRFFRAVAGLRHPRTLAILDRGLMDAEAYMQPGEFSAMAETLGYSVPRLRDERYDAVFHMLSPGVDNPELYKEIVKTNPYRLEQTPEDAAAADRRTLAAWVGHPHLRVIDNSTDFQGKMERLVELILQSYGVPEPLEIEKKFLLPSGLSIPHILNTAGVLWAEVEIEQIYLTREGDFSRRIRKRGQEGHVVYDLTKKRDVEPGVRIELPSARITALDYYYYARDHRDPDCNIIKKKRYCFLWKHQYFELDVVIEPECIAGLMFLELELLGTNSAFEIPDFIPIVTDATKDPRFAMHSLARRK